MNGFERDEYGRWLMNDEMRSLMTERIADATDEVRARLVAKLEAGAQQTAARGQSTWSAGEELIAIIKQHSKP